MYTKKSLSIKVNKYRFPSEILRAMASNYLQPAVAQTTKCLLSDAQVGSVCRCWRLRRNTLSGIYGLMRFTIELTRRCNWPCEARSKRLAEQNSVCLLCLFVFRREAYDQQRAIIGWYNHEDDGDIGPTIT